MPYVKAFLLLLLTVFSYTSSLAQYNLTGEEIKNIRLAYDSLDECREITDSLNIQIYNASRVIKTDSMLIEILKTQVGNCESRVDLNKTLLLEEKKITSVYRKKFIAWKITAIILGGLTVYQSVK